MKVFKISHLVKSEDLNHHGTLFAGRTAEWLVERRFRNCRCRTRQTTGCSVCQRSRIHVQKAC